MSKTFRILAVCLGNICRSPLAEAIVREHLERAGIPALVDSAGTGNWHAGEAPDKRAIRAAKENNIDIDHLRARQFTPLDFERFDLIFAMDRNNFSDITALARTAEERSKVHLFLDFAGVESPLDVPDPYYGTQEDFYAVHDLLDAATAQAMHRLIPMVQGR